MGSSDNDFAVARLNADGKGLDTTFNSTGWVKTDFGGAVDVITAGYVRDTGKIVVGGSSGSYFAMARYNENGSLDTGFASTGNLVVTQLTGSAYAMHTPGGNGTVYLAGQSGGDFAIAAVLANGALYADVGPTLGFSTDGIRYVSMSDGLDSAGGIYVSTNVAGAVTSILVAGSAGNAFAAVRLLADGPLDLDYANATGKVTTAIGASAKANAVIVQADGKAILAGSSDGNFALARYSAGGVLDSTFAGDGVLTIGFGGAEDGYAVAGVWPGGTGTLAVAGRTKQPGHSDYDIAVAQLYLDDSSPVVSVSANAGNVYQEGQTLGFTSTATDTDAPLTYAWSVKKDGIAYTLPGGTVINTSQFQFASADNGSYAVTLAVTDCYGVVGTASITKSVVNVAATLSGMETATLAYTENQVATTITATLVVSDVDPKLTGASVWISGNYQNAQDILSFTNAGSVVGSWNATTGTVTFTGLDTLANYQTALRSVKYRNSSENPSTLARTISFKVNDGVANSAVATRQISVAAVNDSPLNSIPGAQTITEDTDLVFSSANGNAITISDVDAGSGSVTATLATANGTLTLGTTAGVSSTGNGTANVSLTGTVASINTALNGSRFRGSQNFNGAATLSITTDDQGNSGSGGAKTDIDIVAITVNALNDAPTLSSIATLGGATENESFAIAYATLASAANEADPEGSAISFRIEAISSGTLTKNGIAVVPGTTLLGSGEELLWTPALDVNGTIEAFTVKAWDGALASSTAVAIQAEVFGAPSELTVTALSTSSVVINWQDNSMGDSGFVVERTEDGETFVTVGSVAANITTFTDSGLAEGALYTYRVLASRVGDESLVSDPQIGATLILMPTGFTATAISATEVNLAWTDSSAIAPSFAIERTIAGLNVWEVIDSVDAGITQYADTSVRGSTTYQYRVYAWNWWASSDAATDTATTPLGIPNTPANLTATRISATEYQLTWSSDDAQAASFKLYKWDTTGGTWSLIQTVAGTGPGDYTADISGLTSGQDYSFQVTASSGAGESTSSEPAGSTSPTLQTDAEETTISSITLHWSNSGVVWDVELEMQGPLDENFRFVQSLGTGSGDLVMGNLGESQEYSFRLRWVQDGNLSYGSTVTAETDEEVGVPDPNESLPAPTGLEASTDEAGLMTLTWDYGDGATNFTIQARGNDPYRVTTVVFGPPNVTATRDPSGRFSTTFSVAAGGLSVTVTIIARSSTAYSPESSSITVTSGGTTLSALSLSAAPAENGLVLLSWSGGEGSPEPYPWVRVYRAEAGEPGPGKAIAVAGAFLSAGQLQVSAGAPGERFFAVVWGYQYQSPPSNFVNTDGSAEAAPAAPANLKAEWGDDDKVYLIWDNIPNNETAYSIERATDAQFTDAQKVGSTDADVTCFTDTVPSDSGDATYYYRIFACRNPSGMIGTFAAMAEQAANSAQTLTSQPSNAASLAKKKVARNLVMNEIEDVDITVETANGPTSLTDGNLKGQLLKLIKKKLTGYVAGDFAGIVGKIKDFAIPSLKVMNLLIYNLTIKMTVGITYDVADTYNPATNSATDWHEEKGSIVFEGWAEPNSPPIIMPANWQDAATLRQRAAQDLIDDAPGTIVQKSQDLATAEGRTWIP